jgi:hypothetical protein
MGHLGPGSNFKSVSGSRSQDLTGSGSATLVLTQICILQIVYILNYNFVGHQAAVVLLVCDHLGVPQHHVRGCGALQPTRLAIRVLA